MNPEILAAILERLTSIEDVNQRQQILIDKLQASNSRFQKALTTKRDSTIMELGGWEDGLCFERSITPRHKRQK